MSSRAWIAVSAGVVGIAILGLAAYGAREADAERLGAAGLAAQAVEDMTIEAYEPRSTLVVPGGERTRAKFPFVDVHLHLRGTGNLEATIADMDRLNLQVAVNLSGGSGEGLAERRRAYDAHPGRFVLFANADFSNIDGPEFGERAARQLEEDVKNGAAGLKIFKSLGLSVMDARGERVAVNDPRLDPIWAKAGELGVPVLIHTADPAEFWQPMDKRNERWLELKLRPRRKRSDPPSWEDLISEQLAVFKKHSKTTFIAAHLAWMGNDLARLARTLDEIPNMYTELAAVIYEPGRQPRFAKEFFTKYQDRVLMGKDSWRPEEYKTYFRVLETADEYFPYYRKYHAFWRMYGLDLSDEVLKKIYYENAIRIIPGIDRSRFPE